MCLLCNCSMLLNYLSWTCINTRTSTASCTRWKQNHLYCVAMRTSHTHCCCFGRGSNKVRGVFLCQCPVPVFPGGRRTWITVKSPESHVVRSHFGRYDSGFRATWQWISGNITPASGNMTFERLDRLPAHVLGVTRWEVVILNYESGTRCVLPVWYNRRDSSLAT